MNVNNCTLSVIVNGRAITEYSHENLTFVEGREDSNYEIEVKNYNPFRIEIVLSVDGLSVIDGKLAGENSRGYLVEAFGTIRVPGWRLDNSQVASFSFAGQGAKKKANQVSYAEQVTGSDKNNGVIGALIYSESRPQPILRSMYAKSAISASASAYGDIAPQSASQQSLGTGFGESTAFKTTSVKFTRSEQIARMEIFYDNARGLRARGIDLDSHKRRPALPNAFPAISDGCVPPSGWNRG